MPAKNLPQFVVDGTYEDEAWREIASGDSTKRTANQRKKIVAGPARHPYSTTAILDQREENGELIRRWFPNEESRDQYFNQKRASDPLGAGRTSPPAQGAANEAPAEDAKADKIGKAAQPKPVKT